MVHRAHHQRGYGRLLILSATLGSGKYMFGKRRYNRKKGTRKTFRRRTSKKSSILRPPQPPPEIEPPLFNASGSALYLWTHVRPAIQAPARQHKKRGRFTHSLREKCAEVVGNNADAIASSYLEDGTWSCWRPVWQTILDTGADLPALFRMFAQRFGDHRSFSCHVTTDTELSLVYSSLPELRNTALNACLVPFSRRHRMENVFSNVCIGDLVAFLGGLLLASVVLDCSKMPSFAATEVLALCNIPTLKGLDLSGNRQIDDQVLYTIKSRLVLRTSSLEMLTLSGCPLITEKGLFGLLSECSSSNLTYVESDVRLPLQLGFDTMFSRLDTPNQPRVVAGTNWKFVQTDDKVGSAHKYKLGMKYHFVLRQIRAPTASTASTAGSILWDIKFFPKTVDPQVKSAEELFCETWTQRYIEATTRPLEPPFIYMKDDTIPILPRPQPVAKAHTPPVFERAGHVSLPRKPTVKKPKRINTNANAFFLG